MLQSNRVTAIIISSIIKDLKCIKNCTIGARNITSVTNAEVRKQKNFLFNKELERQEALVTRIEKINVKYEGVPENCLLIMNKLESTPYTCALHMNETVAKRTVLAEVNGEPWDMHRPLNEDCVLKFLNFRDDDPYIVNKAFWRSCSFLLGMVLEKAFKEEFYIELHSWPKPNVSSGSYVYDVDLKIKDWTPKEEELRTLSTMMQKLTLQNLKFERLEVESSVALKIFENNRFKVKQIPHIAETTDGIITLYRVDDHIDISVGPMISSTSHLGRNAISSVHQLESEDGTLYRFQGVAIPSKLPLNFYAFQLLIERARKMNTTNLEKEIIKEAIV